MRRPSSNADAIIQVRGLTVGWGERVLEEDVTFDVRRGEIFAILGASGSGKSTLLRFLIGLEPVRHGEVLIDGQPSRELGGDRPSFGVMFQAGALFGSSTVGENVELPLAEWTELDNDAICAVARAKLRLVGLEGSFDQFPSELSGGMKKRAAIARALALEPDLVFLDEPSAGLDPITAAELDQLILTLNRALGVTVVMVTHQLESIRRVASRCIMIDKDARAVIADGEPDELARSSDPRVHRFFNPPVDKSP